MSNRLACLPTHSRQGASALMEDLRLEQVSCQVRMTRRLWTGQKLASVVASQHSIQLFNTLRNNMDCKRLKTVVRFVLGIYNRIDYVVIPPLCKPITNKTRSYPGTEVFSYCTTYVALFSIHFAVLLTARIFPYFYGKRSFVHSTDFN